AGTPAPGRIEPAVVRQPVARLPERACHQYRSLAQWTAGAGRGLEYRRHPAAPALEPAGCGGRQRWTVAVARADSAARREADQRSRAVGADGGRGAGPAAARPAYPVAGPWRASPRPERGRPT